MRKSLLILTASVLAATQSASAWNVASTPQPMKVLLEEFTGIYCGYCPDGHAIANKMKIANPQDIQIINIHTGNLATPRTTSDPDFRTTVGDEIATTFNVSSIPMGMVCRSDFQTGSRLFSRDWWNTLADAVSINDPVNLWVGNTYDPATRTIKVTVEGYYVDAAYDSDCLTVALIENDIPGMQANAPSDQTYIHRYVLRDYISTPTFGEPINGKKYEYFTREFTYTIPADYAGMTPKPENMEIIAFVNDGQKQTFGVTSCHLDTSKMTLEPNAELFEAPLPATGYYDFNFIEVALANKYDQTLTSATFEVVKNDGTPETIEWEGEIAPWDIQIIQVPTDLTKTSTYTLTLKKADGTSVSRESSVTGRIAHDIKEVTIGFDVEILADNGIYNNTFIIYDQDGNFVKEVGPIEDALTTAEVFPMRLPTNKVYCLVVSDRWGNGMTQQRGYVKILNNDGSTALSAMEINGYGTRMFFRTYDPAGLDAVTAAPDAQTTEYFNLQGVKVANPIPGQIVIRRTGETVDKIVF